MSEAISGGNAQAEGNGEYDVGALQRRIAELEEELKNVQQDKNQQKSRDTTKQSYVPKCPLGMRDYGPEEMAIREKVFDTIRQVFKRHGAVSIETPVTELKSTLTGKYGEDSKLIYDLADQGGEILALRYDLTVPFARFCAQHKVQNIKRYHIARVYRRDRPVMNKGRHREFYQCDIDIAGEYEAMVPDAECVKIVSEVLSELEMGEFVVKVNHRRILDGIFSICGVSENLFRPICSAVDKLDKLSWEEVKQEMIQKGITEECAEKIWGYVQHKGHMDLIERLESDQLFMANASASAGLGEMKKLFQYCSAFGVPNEQVSFDLSLARGLDYYTGVIYEAILMGAGVGSVAGGGRYDELVGMFSKKGKKIPCVGVSLGIERLYTVYAEKHKDKVPNKLPTQVLVIGIAAAKEERVPMLEERMKVLDLLWGSKVSAETMQKLAPKTLTQFQYCEDEGIPLSVVFGSSEVSQGVVKVRVTKTREEHVVKREDCAKLIKDLLASGSA